jgi:hypothetical protein
MKRLPMLIAAMSLSLGACGGSPSDSGGKGLDDEDDYQELFWDYCLSLAEILTAVEEEEMMMTGEPVTVDCPDGGTATYDGMTGVITLEACGGAGAEVDGDLTIFLQGGNSATITSGSLTVAGDYDGTADIVEGVMQWSSPVSDSTTYWELRVTIQGEDKHLWSGAEYSECPMEHESLLASGCP